MSPEKMHEVAMAVCSKPCLACGKGPLTYHYVRRKGREKPIGVTLKCCHCDFLMRQAGLSGKTVEKAVRAFEAAMRYCRDSKVAAVMMEGEEKEKVGWRGR